MILVPLIDMSRFLTTKDNKRSLYTCNSKLLSSHLSKDHQIKRRRCLLELKVALLALLAWLSK